MHEGKGKKMFLADLICSPCGRGKGDFQVLLNRGCEMCIADEGMVHGEGEAIGTRAWKRSI